MKVIYGPWPTTREQAKALNAKHYFTGDPCKHGHIAPRFTAKFCCVECSRLAQLSENLGGEAKQRKADAHRSYMSRPDARERVFAKRKQNPKAAERNRANANRYYKRKRLDAEYDAFLSRLEMAEAAE